MAYPNGQLPASALADTTGGKVLAKDAAASYERLSKAFKAKFGVSLAFNPGWTGYRTYDQQVALYKKLGAQWAAYPGTSVHGVGNAGDFDVEPYASTKWKWMNTTGRTYGWSPYTENDPSYEPWHWKYNREKDQHIPAPTPIPEPETDLYTKRGYEVSTKPQSVASGGWVTVKINNDGDTSLLTTNSDFDAGVDIQFSGGTPGQVVKVQFIRVTTDASGNNPQLVDAYPPAEAPVTSGDTFTYWARKGTTQAGERLRVQVAVPSNMTIVRVEARVDYA